MLIMHRLNSWNYIVATVIAVTVSLQSSSHSRIAIKLTITSNQLRYSHKLYLIINLLNMLIFIITLTRLMNEILTTLASRILINPSISSERIIP